MRSTDVDEKVVVMKAASMQRALVAANEAMANGTLKTRNPAGLVPYVAQLRVK